MQKCPMGYEPCRGWDDEQMILRCAQAHRGRGQACVGFALVQEGWRERETSTDMERRPEMRDEMVAHMATQLRRMLEPGWSLTEAAPVLEGDDHYVRVQVGREEFETV